MLFSPGDLVKTFQFRRHMEQDTPSCHINAEVEGFPYSKKEILMFPDVLNLSVAIPENLIGQVVDTLENVRHHEGGCLHLAQVLVCFNDDQVKAYWFFEEELIHLDYTPL